MLVYLIICLLIHFLSETAGVGFAAYGKYQILYLLNNTSENIIFDVIGKKYVTREYLLV